MKLSKEAKIGIVVTLAIAAFIYGFNFLKGVNLFSNSRSYYAVYSRIDGLVPANPVMVNGFKVGQVNDIQMYPDNSGRILVKFIVTDNSVKIPKNSVAKIFSSDLLGSKAVELLLGDSKVYAKSGDTLSPSVEENLKKAVNAQIEPLKEKAEGLIKSIDSVVVVVQTVLNKNARENLNKSFESISNSIQSLEKTSKRLDTLVSSEKNRLTVIFSNIESISTNLVNNNQKITNIINNLSDVSDSLAKSNIKTTIANANTALGDAAKIMDKINKGQGTMGLLVNNDTLYNKLQGSADQLDKLLQDLRMNPKRYVHFSIFGKKDKNKPKK